MVICDNSESREMSQIKRCGNDEGRRVKDKNVTREKLSKNEKKSDITKSPCNSLMSVVQKCLC